MRAAMRDAQPGGRVSQAQPLAKVLTAQLGRADAPVRPGRFHPNAGKLVPQQSPVEREVVRNWNTPGEEALQLPGHTDESRRRSEFVDS
jgi:hypothetical protein